MGGHVLPGRERHRIADFRLAGELSGTQAAAAELRFRIHAHIAVLRPRHHVPQLIIFRVLQGLTGGGLQPLAQAILLETFPKESHGHAMAAFGIGILRAPILGPTLGGWITDNYTWRWIFYLNLPVGILSLFLMNPLLQYSKAARAAKAAPELDEQITIPVGFLEIELKALEQHAHDEEEHLIHH